MKRWVPQPLRSAPRGVALVSALIVIAILMASVAGLMYYATNSRGRAINITREAHRTSCSEAGLQLARAYFGRQQALWNTYLAAPQVYNPVRSTLWPVTSTADPFNPGGPTGRAVLMASNPELFADIDGNGRPDVYLYIRDNEDERPSQTNWFRDNDQNVIVGAVCISDTLTPRNARGALYQGYLSVEAILSYNMPSNGYNQANGGDGSGNYN